MFLLVNIAFDPNSNIHRIFKKHQKNANPPHIVSLCHIVTISVDKESTSIFKQKNLVHGGDFSLLPYEVQGWREVVQVFEHEILKKLPKASFRNG